MARRGKHVSPAHHSVPESLRLRDELIPGVDIPLTLDLGERTVLTASERRILEKVVWLYTDGGCILRQPSPYGGTWAWLGIDTCGDVVVQACGVLPASTLGSGLAPGLASVRTSGPQPLPHPAPTVLTAASASASACVPAYPGAGSAGDEKISNNLAEFVAMVRALEAMRDGWCGWLCSDSKLTLDRLLNGHKLTGIPNSWCRRMGAQQRRLGTIEGVQLSGHPSNLALDRGFSKQGKPVSEYNVIVDQMARRAGEAYMSAHPELLVNIPLQPHPSFLRRQQVAQARSGHSTTWG